MGSAENPRYLVATMEEAKNSIRASLNTWNQVAVRRNPVMTTKLEVIAKKAQQELKLVFTSLAHHITEGLLWESLCHSDSNTSPVWYLDYPNENPCFIFRLVESPFHSTECQ